MKQWITHFSLIVFVSLVTFSAKTQDLFFDDFSTGIGDWTVQGLGEENWTGGYSNTAGGTAPELLLTYAPEFTGTSRIVSPIINTSGYTELHLEFLTSLNVISDGGVDIAVETTSDGGTTWNEVWTQYWNDDENDYNMFEILTLMSGDIGSESFQFCFKFSESSVNLYTWAIDDVKLVDELTSYDVSTNNILGLENPIYNEDGVIISALISNYGQETVSFDVILEIDDGSTVIFDDTQSVIDLELGEQVQVDFSTWIAIEGVGYTATVTTLLSGDEYPNNDQKTTIFDVYSNTGYCIPAGDGVMWIDGFEFAGILNTASGAGENGYSDFTDLQGTAEIGSTYTANIVFGSGSMLMNTSIWIDFNQDLIFDSSELILTDSMPTGFSDPLVVDLQIPWDVVTTGITRMRIGAQFFSPASVNPCGTVFYGEWEDYTIEITGGALDIDAAIVSIDMYKAYEQGNITPVATIENWGNETSSFPVTCNIEGGYTSTINITDLALGEAIQIEFDSWNAAPGEYLLEVEADLSGDTNPENDHMEKMISIAETAPFKMVMGEEGTGTWCGFCPKGAVYMDSMAVKYPETWIGAAVHNGDPMVNTEYDTHISALIEYAYPRITVNRISYTDPIEVENLYNEKMDYIAFADITIENKIYNETTHELSFTLTSNFVSTVSNFRFSAVLVENNVTGPAPDYNQANYYSGGTYGPMGGYENLPDPVPAEDMIYDHVGRAIIGGFEGVDGSLPSTVNYGETHSYEFSIIVDEGWDVSQIEVIGMLIDHETGYINNATVDHLITGITDIQAATEILVYPNPATDQVNINSENTIESITVYNFAGQVVLTESVNNTNYRVNTSNLDTGIYIIKVFSQDNVITRKLVIE